jgi:drug/metabolite transporter (DMT)-like permease
LTSVAAETAAAPGGAAANPTLGIGYKVAATFMLTVMLTLIKLVSTRFTIGEIVFCRSFFALIPLFVWVGATRQFGTVFKTHNYWGHIRRSAAGTAAIFLNFGALFFLPIADATAIGYSMPLLTLVLAVFILGEVVHLYRWLAIGVGFLGILVILHGYVGQGGLTSGTVIGAILAIAGSFAGAMAVIQIRTLARFEPATTIVVYFSILTSLAGLVTVLGGLLDPGLAWSMPSASDAIMLVVIGIAGGIAQLFVTLSYRYTGASAAAPFEYTSMIWALAASWLVFGTWPSANVLVGSAIVIVAGLFVIYRERTIAAPQATKEVRDANQPHARTG